MAIFKRLAQMVMALIFLLASTLPSSAMADMSEARIREMLGRPHEQNADELMEMIRQRQFKEVEAFLRYVDRHNITTRDGFRYIRALLEEWFFASEVLEFHRPKPVPQDILPLLDVWIAQYPDSEIGLLIRGVFYIERAWEIRSRGYGKDVKKENWDAFRSLHLMAKADLEKAFRLNPSNPHPSRQLMRVQRALDAKDEAATNRYFHDAVRKHPTFYWAYRAKLENMMPKWGGDWESMFAFAMETANHAPPGSLLPHILACAIEEAGQRSKDQRKYLNDPKVWNTLEKIYTQIIAEHPDSAWWKVRFALVALRAGKEDLALNYLNLVEKLNPKDHRMIELKVAYAEDHQQWAVEARYAQVLTELCPQYDRGHAALGYAALKQDKCLDAIDSFTRAIELAPETPRHWANRCRGYTCIQQHDKAIADCTKAIALDGDFAFAYRQRAEAFERSGNITAAMADRETYKRLTK
jgi:tetratricopeptide (TPR) repeat protein